MQGKNIYFTVLAWIVGFAFSANVVSEEKAPGAHHEAPSSEVEPDATPGTDPGRSQVGSEGRLTVSQADPETTQNKSIEPLKTADTPLSESSPSRETERGSHPGRGMWITGVVLTSVGLVGTVPGIFFIVEDATSSGVETTTTAEDGTEETHEVGTMPTGSILGGTLLGISALFFATGIPLWIIGWKRMKEAKTRVSMLELKSLALDPGGRASVSLGISF